MKNKIFFDDHAPDWDSKHKTVTADEADKAVLRFCINKGDRILDVGSGTGILLPHLKKKAGRNGKIIALDISQKMLDESEKKFGNKFEYVCADVVSMPFENSVFDKVICFSCFPHFGDKQKAFREIYRILKPGGIVFVSHASSREHINSFHHGVGGPVKHDRLPEKEIMTGMFEEAGFNSVKIINKKDYYLASGIKPVLQA
ncbi:MAG: class I SAM-dependent methyltransferase [Endomicrobiales bacterium]|nr:class I SAM-dependent methyltransferase [Endomicrobiales bacterium]